MCLENVETCRYRGPTVPRFMENGSVPATPPSCWLAGGCYEEKGGPGLNGGDLAAAFSGLEGSCL